MDLAIDGGEWGGIIAVTITVIMKLCDFLFDFA